MSNTNVTNETVTTNVTRLGDFLHFGQLFQALATINLSKFLTFLGNFCKGIKIQQFSSEIIFGQLLQTFGDFYLVTLDVIQIQGQKNVLGTM